MKQNKTSAREVSSMTSLCHIPNHPCMHTMRENSIFMWQYNVTTKKRVALNKDYVRGYEKVMHLTIPLESVLLHWDEEGEVFLTNFWPRKMQKWKEWNN
jgi:hypothetical protein